MEGQSMTGLPSRGVGSIAPNPESVKKRLNEETLEEGHNPPLGYFSYPLPP